MLSMRTLARTQTFLWPFPLQNDLRSLTIDCQLELNLSQLPLDGRRGSPSAQYAPTVPIDVFLGGLARSSHKCGWNSKGQGRQLPQNVLHASH